MRRAFLVVLSLAASCRAGAEGPTLHVESLGDQHVERRRTVARVAVPSDRGKVQHHMRGLIDDLRQVDTMLAAGRLDEARALAFMLSRPVRDPRLQPYGPEYERVATAALALASATCFDEAYRLAPRVVAACANCHDRAGVKVAALDKLGPTFERVSKR